MVLGLSACGGKSADNGTTAAGNTGTTQAAEKPPQHRGRQPLKGDHGCDQHRMGYHDAANTTSNYTRMICDQIYDRLTQSNADGTCEGRLAKSGA